MLMNAAAGGTKSVIKNVDDYLLRPLGEGFFRFNMQFDFDPEIKGDLEVKARGTESLMANEVRSQRLMQFLGVASNPALAPFAKFQYIIREIAKSLDLDPDKVTNNMDEAALQAELLKGFKPQQKISNNHRLALTRQTQLVQGWHNRCRIAPIAGEQDLKCKWTRNYSAS